MQPIYIDTFAAGTHAISIANLNLTRGTVVGFAGDAGNFYVPSCFSIDYNGLQNARLSLWSN